MRAKSTTIVALVAAVSASAIVSNPSSASLDYTYDELHRLTEVQYDSGVTVTYQYDELGNRTRRTVTASPGVDTDGDGVLDAADSAPNDPFLCRDVDGDSCDDCSSGTDNPASDGTDSDVDGLCNLGDADDDNDGVLDPSDGAPTDPFLCRDVDADTCDDCSSGTDAPFNDGADLDLDGLCDAGDLDDDEDGLLDTVETGTGIYISPTDTGSDPLDADSDDDGTNDGDEVAAGSDPNNAGFTPISITAASDTSIFHDGPIDCGDSSFATSEIIKTNTRYTGDRANRGLVEFDLSSVGSCPVVESATLNLYAEFESEFTTNTFFVNPISTPWVDSTADWCSPWSTDGGDWASTPEASTVVPSKHFGGNGAYDEWIQWDVTQAVQDWVDGSVPNYGFMVRQVDIAQTSDNQAIHFSSSDTLTPALAPELVITCGPAVNRSIDLERDTSQYLEITHANQSDLDLTGDLTFELWLKLESDDVGVLFAKRNPATQERAFGLTLLADGSPTVNTVRFTNSSDGSNLGFADVPWSPSTDTWYHLALVYDADGGGSSGQIELFIDGTSLGTATGGLYTSIFNNTSPFRIAIDDDLGGANYFDGKIDEARVWNDVRTATEINDNRVVDLTGSEPNLVAYWKFDNNLLDETPNTNDLLNPNGLIYSTDVPIWSDQDSDGILDDGDGSGIIGDNTCVGGTTTSCDDNCIATSNAAQVDTNSDSEGDACDPDDDGDGLLDTVETDTGTYVSPTDTGSDPLDSDTDDDGFLDSTEVFVGSDPNNASSTPVSVGANNPNSIDLERDSGQYLSLTDASQFGLDFLTELTLEAWVRMKSLPGIDEEFYIISKSNGSDIGYGLALQRSAGGQLQLMFEIAEFQASGKELFRNDWDPIVDTWYHVAARFDGASNQVKFFVDGIQQGPTRTTTINTTHDTALDFAVGGRDGGAKTFDGLMDEVRVWDVARTPSEIHADRYEQLMGTEPGLAGYWRLNGDFLDETSNLNDLSNNGGATYSPDTPFGARAIDLQLDLMQYASIPDASQVGLDITGDLTIEVWVKQESSGPDRAVVTKHDGDANERSFYFGIYNDAVRFLVSENGSGSSSQTSSTADTLLTVGAWQHIAVTYDSETGTAVHYLNGGQDGQSSAHKTAIANRDAPVAVGASFDNGTPIHFFDGLIDDVRIWNHVRTGSEIAQKRHYELSGTENGLAAYWRFNGDLLDDTANQNDLTDVGAPGYSADVIPVPEPASWLVLLAGSVLLRYLDQRRRREAS